MGILCGKNGKGKYRQVDKHYMVDLESRLEEIRQMIDDGEYFVINRVRQYGKMAILRALSEYLKRE